MPHPDPTLAQQAQHASLMAELSQRLRTGLDAILPIGRPVVFVDYPLNWELGDHLIWQATEHYFEQRGIRVLARFSARNLPQRLRGYPPETIFVGSGGGTFGDLHPASQGLRTRLVRHHRRHRIVILPQSIHFTQREVLLRTAADFRSHPDLHLCVRDAASVRLAREHFGAHVHLLPDMAHLLWPPVLDAKPRARRLGLFVGLAASEAHPHRATPPGDCETLEWAQLVGRRDRALHRGIRLLLPLDRMLSGLLAGRLHRDWQQLSRAWLERVLECLRERPEVVTDRLDAHLLACLLGRPSCVGDDPTHRVRAYLECWTGISPLVRRWHYPEDGSFTRPTKVGEM